MCFYFPYFSLKTIFSMILTTSHRLLGECRSSQTCSCVLPSEPLLCATWPKDSCGRSVGETGVQTPHEEGNDANGAWATTVTSKAIKSWFEMKVPSTQAPVIPAASRRGFYFGVESCSQTQCSLLAIPQFHQDESTCLCCWIKCHWNFGVEW